jgi:hypothetical protein
MEKLGSLDVSLPTGTWPVGYPDDKNKLLSDDYSNFFIPDVRPDININFDLKSTYPIDAIYIKNFPGVQIQNIRVGLHNDDGYKGPQPDSQGKFYLPNMTDPVWKWYDGIPMPIGYTASRNEQVISFPTLAARYVQIQLRGGYGGIQGLLWALQKIKISGTTSGQLQDLKNLKATCDNKSECNTNILPSNQSCTYDNRYFYYSWKCVTNRNVVMDSGSTFVPSVADNKGIFIKCPVAYNNSFAVSALNCTNGYQCMTESISDQGINGTGICKLPSIDQECMPSIGCISGYHCKVVNTTTATYRCMVSRTWYKMP